jgi:SAM-dependent methyltransferase
MASVFCGDARARLAAAEDLLDDGTQRLVAHLGVGPEWACLEVGAGGGSIAAWLAERTQRVVATDLDTRVLDPSRYEVRAHNLVSDELETRAFDLVHARLVLEHIPERDAVLRKLAAALKPGGWLLVESVDYVSAVPVSALGAAEHAHTQSVRLEHFAARGVDHDYGRKLPALLRALGLTDVGNEGRAWVMTGGSPGARWFAESLAHLRPQLPLADAEVDAMLALFANPEWSALSPLIVAAWGRAPA